MLLLDTGLSHHQLHGVDFQHQLSYAFAGRPVPNPHTKAWDIPSKFDRFLGLPTSIKSVGVKNTVPLSVIAMADARRMFSIAHPFRILVAPYTQSPLQKAAHQIFEFLVHPGEMDRLCGSLTYEEVEAFHEGLKVFEPGQHVAGRQWAKQHKQELVGHCQSSFILNPKVGNKDGARRLQCSLRMGTLMDTVAQWRVHQGEFYGLPLPLVISSTSREFLS